jgi:hypothetical protein
MSTIGFGDSVLPIGKSSVGQFLVLAVEGFVIVVGLALVAHTIDKVVVPVRAHPIRHSLISALNRARDPIRNRLKSALAHARTSMRISQHGAAPSPV